MTVPSAGHTTGQLFNRPHGFFVRVAEVVSSELNKLPL
jgi:hypothetical protein